MYWTTKEGKRIEIQDMTDDHIRNCIKMLDREGTYVTGVSGVDASDMYCEEEPWCEHPTYKALKEELMNRVLGLK